MEKYFNPKKENPREYQEPEIKKGDIVQDSLGVQKVFIAHNPERKTILVKNLDGKDEDAIEIDPNLIHKPNK